MDLATIFSTVTAGLMIAVSAFLHWRLRDKFWLAVFITCGLFLLPIPFLVYTLENTYLRVVTPAGDIVSKPAVVVAMSAFTVLFAFLISAFTGLVIKRVVAHYR